MEFIQELRKTEKKVKIHIEIETGMGRTGINSNGILNFSSCKENYNLVQAGIIMYGYPSDLNHPSKMNLKPVCTLKSKITFIKKLINTLVLVMVELIKTQNLQLLPQFL